MKHIWKYLADTKFGNASLQCIKYTINDFNKTKLVWILQLIRIKLSQIYLELFKEQLINKLNELTFSLPDIVTILCMTLKY